MILSIKHTLFLLFLLFSISLIKVSGQDIPFKTYTIENGLPSSKIYDIIQDNKGYIWFATDYGVSQFDGEIFKNYSVSDQLSTNTIIKLFLNDDGILYFLNADGKINVFNQIFTELNLNQLIKEKLNGEVANHFLVKPDHIDLTTSNGKHYTITNKLVEHSNPGAEKLKGFYFLPYKESYTWGKCDPSSQRKKLSSNISQNGDTIFLTLENEYQEVPAISFNKLGDQNGEYVLTLNNKLYFIKSDTVIAYEFESFINDVFIDNKNDIWISINRNGVLHYKNTDLSQISSKYFINKNILKTFQDREGNYWLISDNEGILCINTLDFMVYDNIKQNIISLDVKGDKLLFSTYENEVYECTIRKHEIVEINNIVFDKKVSSFIEDILIQDDGSFWILYSNFNEFRNFGTSFPVDLTAINYTSYPSGKNQKRAKYIDKINFENSKIEYTPSFGIYRGKQFSISTDNTGKIWLKTLEGLFNSIGFNFKFLQLDYDESKKQLTDIQSTDEYVVIGTRKSGLRIISSNNDLLNINSETYNSFPSNAIRKILIDSLTIWIGSNNGICRLLRSKQNENEFIITSFMSKGGFPINEVNDIVRHNNIIWIGGNNGLLSFKPDEIEIRKPYPILSFNRIAINDVDTLLCKKFVLNPKQNTITFSFKGISINAGQNLFYKYRLIGLDSNWIVSKNNTVRYPKLNAGQYQFIVYCSSDGINWNKDYLTKNIIILTHFTRTILFGIIILFLLLLLITFIILVILRNQKRKNSIEKNLLQAEISSLRSQMNPHFIYNCMNSIQGYIVRNENNLASEYIDNFARLLRTVVESSRKKFITLDLELTTLAQYLELEKLRFSWKFDYGINIDSNVDTTAILIPPLLIQPFVENSIHHGFATLKGNSLITITIKDDEKANMTVIIEDNGIGREKASAIADKRQNHKSVGMQNIHDRIAMLNKIYSSHISLEVIDLYSDKNIASGTKVILEIPQLIKLSGNNE